MEEESAQESLMPSVARSLMDPMAIYTFKITTVSAHASSVAGSILLNTFFNPAGVGEFNSLSALFDMVRIAYAKITISNRNPHADGYATGVTKGTLFIACDAGLSGTNPASVQSVVDCPNVKAINLGSSEIHTLSYKPPVDIGWAGTSSPAPAPGYGCYGQFSMGAANLTVSTTYYDWMLECVYEFTSRT
jgi:hypothetical protein